MKEERRNKKGISPLIATALLVALVVTASIVFTFYYKNLKKVRKKRLL